MRKLLIFVLMLSILSGCGILFNDYADSIEFSKVNFETIDIETYRSFENEPEIKAIDWILVLGEENELVLYSLGDVESEDEFIIEYKDLRSLFTLDSTEKIVGMKIEGKYEDAESVDIHVATDQSRFIVISLGYIESNSITIKGDSVSYDFNELDHNHDYYLAYESILPNEDQNLDLIDFGLQDNEVIIHSKVNYPGYYSVFTSDNRYIEVFTGYDYNKPDLKQITVPSTFDEEILKMYTIEDMLILITVHGNVYGYYTENDTFYFLNNVIQPYDVEVYSKKEKGPIGTLELSQALYFEEDDRLIGCNIYSNNLCFSDSELYSIVIRSSLFDRNKNYFFYESEHISENINIELSGIKEAEHISHFLYSQAIGTSGNIKVLTKDGVYILVYDSKEDESIVFE